MFGILLFMKPRFGLKPEEYRKQDIKANGQILHAYQLTFVHPRTKEEMTFTCPLDEECLRAIEHAKNRK